MQQPQALVWTVAPRRLPGPHAVTPLSCFDAIQGAASVDPVFLEPRGAVVDLPDQTVSLDGEWERCVDRGRAQTRSTSFDLPSADLAWTKTHVPQNYGIEPALEFYHGPLWYRRALQRPPEARWLDLWFDAVDYLADVVLDGVHLGRHEGYFAPFRFDLSERLREGATAELIVRVQDPLEDLKDGRLAFNHRKRWIKGTMSYHDSRPGGPPGNTTPGWSFVVGQSMPSGGIVGSVSLRSGGPVQVDQMFATPLDRDGGLHLALVFRNRTDRMLRAECRIELETPGGQQRTSALESRFPPAPSRLDLQTRVAEPVLWRDAGHSALGGPALYTARASVIQDGEPCSTTRVTFGLRTAEFPMEPRFQYVLNGRSMFIRAANYIPSQHWARLDPAFYEKDFRLLKAANLHSVGLHAHIQSPACYEAADREGISIFQDFPLCWAYASGAREDPGFVPRAAAMAAEMAYLLWNHPSVVYYTAHNEPVYVLKRYFAEMFPHDLTYAKTRFERAKVRLLNLLLTRLVLPSRRTDTPEADGLNRHLDTAVSRAIATVDPLRFVHMGSGAGFDWHEYTCTLAGGRVYDVGRIRKPFISEFGSSPVDRSAVGRSERWAEPWPPEGDKLNEFRRQGVVWLETEEMAGSFARYSDLASFAYACERKAAFAAKYHVEYYRIHHDDPYTGYRWHFFVNWWDRMGCGLMDVDRVPTLAYHALGQASRPRLAATTMPDTIFQPGRLSFPIHGINDSASSWETTVRWRVERLRSCEVIRAERSRKSSPLRASVEGSYVLPLPGTLGVVAEGEIPLAVESNRARRIGDLSIDLPSTGVYRLVMSWEGREHPEENDYTVLLMPEGWEPDVGLSVVQSQ